jgi:excisionase family DNA binding protein
MQRLLCFATMTGRAAGLGRGQIVETDGRAFYNVSEAARILGVSRSTVWRWIDAGELSAYRVGPKTIRIKAEDLAALMRPARARGAADLQAVNGPARSATRRPRKAPSAEPEIRVARPSADVVKRRLQALESSIELRRAQLNRRGGVPFPSSWQLINDERDARSEDR